jgi:hypothetical protein
MTEENIWTSDGTLRRDGHFSVSFTQVGNDGGDTTGIHGFVKHEPSGESTTFHMEAKDLNRGGGIEGAYEDAKKRVLAQVDAAE